MWMNNLGEKVPKSDTFGLSILWYCFLDSIFWDICGVVQ